MTIEEIVEREVAKALPDRGSDRAKIFNSAVSINRAARAACLAVARAVLEECATIARVAGDGVMFSNPAHAQMVAERIRALAAQGTGGEKGR